MFGFGLGAKWVQVFWVSIFGLEFYARTKQRPHTQIKHRNKRGFLKF
jgi:hypothetical protein